MDRILAFVQSLTQPVAGKLLAPATLASYASSIRSSLPLSREQQLLLDTELKRAQLVSATEMDLPDPLSFASISDVKSMVQVLLDKGDTASCDTALAILIQYSTMSRVGEVAGIRSEDLRFIEEGVQVSFRVTKKRVYFVTKLVPATLWGLDMRRWLQRQSSSSPFLANVDGLQLTSDALQARISRVIQGVLGSGRLASHALRRGAAIEALRLLPESHVQSFGAWSQRDSMQSYVRPLRTRQSWLHATDAVL
jgi:integrase